MRLGALLPIAGVDTLRIDSVCKLEDPRRRGAGVKRCLCRASEYQLPSAGSTQLLCLWLSSSSASLETFTDPDVHSASKVRCGLRTSFAKFAAHKVQAAKRRTVSSQRTATASQLKGASCRMEVRTGLAHLWDGHDSLAQVHHCTRC